MNVTKYEKSDYSGGLNSTASLREIAPNEATVLQNWDITYQGQLRRRDGLTLIGNIVAPPISGLGAFIRTNGVDLLRSYSNVIEYLNGLTWSPLQNNLVAGKPMWFENVQILGRMYFCNEDNPLQYWDRASSVLNSAFATVPSNPPHGNVIIWYKNFLFHLNNVKVGAVQYPQDIFWSNLGNPDAYDTTNNHATVPGDGDLITAAPLGDNLVLFKERSVQFLSGWGNSSWQITGSSSNYNSVSEEVGCIAPRGACQVGDEVWFIDNQARIRRVTRTDFDAFRHDVVSKKIQSSLDNINKSQLTKAVMWAWNNKVYCAVPNGTDATNSIIFVFDILASLRTGGEAWTTYTGWFPSVAVSYPTATTMDMYIGDAIQGAVYLHKGVDDNGAAINAIFEDGNFDFSKPEQYKNYKMGYYSAQANQSGVVIPIDTSIDSSPYVNIGNLTISSDGTTFGPTGNATFGPTGNAKFGGASITSDRFTYDQNGQYPLGKRIRHRIRHNTPGQQPSVNSFSGYYKPRAQR